MTQEKKPYTKAELNTRIDRLVAEIKREVTYMATLEPGLLRDRAQKRLDEANANLKLARQQIKSAK